MAKVPNGAETLPKISTGWVGCTSVTCRQTTDGRTGDSIRSSLNTNRKHHTFSKIHRSAWTWLREMAKTSLRPEITSSASRKPSEIKPSLLLNVNRRLYTICHLPWSSWSPNHPQRTEMTVVGSVAFRRYRGDIVCNDFAILFCQIGRKFLAWSFSFATGHLCIMYCRV